MVADRLDYHRPKVDPEEKSARAAAGVGKEQLAARKAVVGVEMQGLEAMVMMVVMMVVVMVEPVHKAGR